MVQPRPAYRGTLCKAVLKLLRDDPDGANDVLDLVPNEHIEAVDRFRGLGWLDSEILDSINAAQIKAHGSERFIDFWRNYTVNAVDGPLLGPLIQGALRIFGSNPGGLIGWVGRAWNVTTRDYGRFDNVSAATGATLTLRDLHRNAPVQQVALSTTGSLQGLMELAGYEGEISIDQERLKRDRVVVFRVTWSPKRVA